MLTEVLIAQGHGYDNPSTPGRERCTAFDGYTVLREPLPTRASRILGRVDGKEGTGCDYGSHSIKLAVRTDDLEYGRKHPQLFILMHHGGGREVVRMKTMYDGGITAAALLALPDVALYGVLYMMWDMATTAARSASSATKAQWQTAFVKKQIRRRAYPSKGYVKVWIDAYQRSDELATEGRIR